jgi:2-polyprenyl-3-methyl-5-hydroxy-6-metoxy-1,4-benzoquinol methylase
MDQTAATVANLIRYRLPEYPKVLDVGCAGGTLAGELPPSVHYLGIDASESAMVPSRFMLELTGASSGDMRLSDHAARSMI